MARICMACRMPVAPVNECICPEDEPGGLTSLNPDPPAGKPYRQEIIPDIPPEGGCYWPLEDA